MDLKLAKLPDRTPVKIAVTISPQLAHKLGVYAELYNATYSGNTETVADLIPYMLDSFLDADRNFAKALRERETSGVALSPLPQAPRRRRRGTQHETKPATEA